MTYRDALIEANYRSGGELLATLQASSPTQYGDLLALHILQAAVRTGDTLAPKPTRSADEAGS